MEPASGLCAGCFRTLDEIARWSRIDDTARAAILADVARRRDSAPAAVILSQVKKHG